MSNQENKHKIALYFSKLDWQIKNKASVQFVYEKMNILEQCRQEYKFT